MLLQTNERLTPEINKYGCYLMSILYIGCKSVHFNTQHLTIENILSIHKECVNKKYIKPDCFVVKANGILEVLSTCINQEIFIKYTGIHSKQVIAKDNQYILGAWKWKFTHFVVMDGSYSLEPTEHVEYDPLGVSRSVTHGELISTRIFT